MKDAPGVQRELPSGVVQRSLNLGISLAYQCTLNMRAEA
jgi:hypothetical protein